VRSSLSTGLAFLPARHCHACWPGQKPLFPGKIFAGARYSGNAGGFGASALRRRLPFQPRQQVHNSPGTAAYCCSQVSQNAAKVISAAAGGGATPAGWQRVKCRASRHAFCSQFPSAVARRFSFEGVV